MTNRLLGWLTGLAALVAAGPFVAPEVMAFPYQQDFGPDQVWSTSPIPRERMAAILADANARIAASPLARMPEGRRIFLTDGGWRWKVLALRASGAMALTRAAREDMIVNHTNLATGTVRNGMDIGGTRLLAGVIAHEKCHGMERHHFGLFIQFTAPQQVFEGYCDYVAGESSLSDADYALLKARGWDHPAIPYYEGRKKVAAILEANGGDVDTLFAEGR